MHGFSRALHAVMLSLTASLGLFLAACSEIQRVTPDDCGNHIVEDGEDCDGSKGCSSGCRLTCKVDADCPDGWGCARSEGFCRAASGDFEFRSVPNDGLGWLTVADFDGDLRDDLLSVSRFETSRSSVAYFDAKGDVERDVSLPSASWGGVGDVSGDGLPDVLLGGTTVAAFRSTKSKSFSPIVGALREVAPNARLFAADVDCNGLRDFVLLGGDESQPDDTLFSITPSGAPMPLGRLRIGAEALHQLENPLATGDFPSALGRAELLATGSVPDPRFDESSLTLRQCQMVALPAPGLAAVDVYTFFESPAAALAKPVRITFGSPDATPPNRFFFADINGDFHDDLVIAGAGEQWVSYGVGDGTFHSNAATLPAPFTTGGDGGVEALGQQLEVLAATELDGDYDVDFFTPDLAGDFEAPYQSARVLDLTGDGLLDVAAVGLARRIDVFRGHPSGLASRLSLRLAGFPRIEDVGDFDGDGIADLLFSEADAADQNPYAASVLFAPVSSESAAPTQLAAFERIEQVAGGYLPAELGRPVDASMDICALFSTGDTLQLGFIAGSSDRLLRSELPTELPRSPDDGYGNSIPFTGYFRSKDELDLVVLKTPSSSGEGIRLQRLTTGSGGLTVVSRSVINATLAFETKPAVADLDGDGVDELYLAVDEGLLTLDAASDAFAAGNLVASDKFYWVDAQDSNRDGFRDLTAFGDEGLLLVLGGSRESARQVHRFSRSTLSCTALLDYAFLQADSDPEPELLVNCTTADLGVGVADKPLNPDEPEPLPSTLALYDVDLESDRLTLVSDALPPLESSHFVTGDFNGDGLDDVAGGSSEVTILLGVPAQ